MVKSEKVLHWRHQYGCSCNTCLVCNTHCIKSILVPYWSRCRYYILNTMRPRRNDRHFIDIFKCICFKEEVCIVIGTFVYCHCKYVIQNWPVRYYNSITISFNFSIKSHSNLNQPETSQFHNRAVFPVNAKLGALCSLRKRFYVNALTNVFWATPE